LLPGGAAVLKIAAVASEFAVLQELPVDLRERLRQRHGVVVRRINRYIALALCGALRCRDSAGSIAPDAALYLACDLPMAAATAHVLQGIHDEGRAPSPFEFMNLVGNMAGFCIGEQLGLRGPQLSLSRHGASLEAALELLALRSTPHRRALLGNVDEGIWPLAEHRRRLGLSDDMPLSECSHWLYVDADCAQPRALIESCARYRDDTEARLALRGLSSETELALGSGIPRERHEEWRLELGLEVRVDDDRVGVHGLGGTARRLIRFIEYSRAPRWLHLTKAGDGSVHALRARRA
jgi:hypothetical protein